jgi:hypothetical protein
MAVLLTIIRGLQPTRHPGRRLFGARDVGGALGVGRRLLGGEPGR